MFNTFISASLQKKCAILTLNRPKAYNALDIISMIEDGHFLLDEEKRYELLIAFNKIRKEFRNEKLLLMFVINFSFLDKNISLENMTFI